MLINLLVLPKVVGQSMVMEIKVKKQCVDYVSSHWDWDETFRCVWNDASLL